MPSAQTEYKARSLGEISGTECREKETLGPVEIWEMRSRASERAETKGM